MTWQRIVGIILLIGAAYFVFTEPVPAAHAVHGALNTIGTGFSRFMTFLEAL